MLLISVVLGPRSLESQELSSEPIEILCRLYSPVHGKGPNSVQSAARPLRDFATGTRELCPHYNPSWLRPPG